jgi:ABC-type uncharacterized transport system permease subunit
MKKLFLTFIFMTLFLSPALSAQATTSIFDTAGDKLKATSERAGLGDPTQSQTNTRLLVSRIINTTIGLLGVAAVLLIVYAGGLWLTASGNDTQVTKAKGIIRSTIVGVLIVGFAYAITAFVLSLLLKEPPVEVDTESGTDQSTQQPVPTRVE